MISSAEWCAKPFFSNSLAQFAAVARSGAIANNDTIDFMSSNSFASRLTWARNCVVVFPSSETSYTHERFLDWQVLHFGLTPSHFDLRFLQLSHAMDVIFPLGVRNAYVPDIGD